MLVDDPTLLDLVTLGHRLRSGTLTSVALTEACLARIEAENEALRAFITVTAESARAAAIKRIRQQHGVVEVANSDAVAGHHQHVEFEILPDLEHAVVFEQRFQKRNSVADW